VRREVLEHDPETIVRAKGLVKSFRERRSGGGDSLAWRDALSRLVHGHNSGKRLTPALDGVDLEVRRGEVLGVLGLNGAGKTTLLKLLTAQLTPDAGDASIYGFDIWRQRRQVRSAVSLVKFGGWQNSLFQLTLRGNLEFYAKLNGLPADLARTRIDEALDMLGLTAKANEYPWYLSAGQLQKLNLAQVFLVRTPLVVLDEPTAHLDPVVSRQIRSFIKDVFNGRLGQTVLLSTHYVHEAEDLCDRIAFLHKGRVRRLGTPDELTAAIDGTRWLWVEAADLGERESAVLEEEGWTTAGPEVGAGRFSRPLAPGQDAYQTLSPLRKHKLRVEAMWVTEPTVEDLFQASLEED
jgi:ABC-2 type transport system ATP-binding protein